MGADCTKCPLNHFKGGRHGTCRKCEEGSTAPTGSTSCSCVVGKPYDDNDTERCGCVAGRPPTGPGRVKTTAMPWNCWKRAMPAFKRKIRRHFPIFLQSAPGARCPLAMLLSPPGCIDDFSGNLCSDCAAGHYANSKMYRACADIDITLKLLHSSDCYFDSPSNCFSMATAENAGCCLPKESKHSSILWELPYTEI